MASFIFLQKNLYLYLNNVTGIILQVISKNYLRIFFLRLILFIVSFIWFAGIISPCVLSNSNLFLNQYLNIFYGTVCHQESAKTFICNQTGFFVCARCTGIYFSVVVLSFLLLLLPRKIKISTKFLIYLSLPMLADVIFYSIGFYQYNKFAAAVTGFLFGSAVFIYILEAFENYISNISEK